LLYPRAELQSTEAYALQHEETTRVFGILMFGFLGIVTMYVFSTLLTANGNLKQLNIIALAGISLNFLFNLLLVPRLQATGGAIASLITLTTTATGYLLLAVHFFKFKTDFRFIFTILLFALLVTGISFGSRLLSFHWFVNLSLMLVSSFAAAFVLKLINIPEMVRLVKERANKI